MSIGISEKSPFSKKCAKKKKTAAQHTKGYVSSRSFSSTRQFEENDDFSGVPTIFAPITAIGKAGVAVIRISGSKALQAVKFLGVNKNLKPRISNLCSITDPESKEIIDNALITFFKAPNSFTGEDVIELNLHASSYIIRRVTELLLKLEDVRLAEAGEFSKTAFLNGKMDLVQAEAIVDLIESETKEQHKQALRQMHGDLSNIYENWRERLINITANIEAYIDFPDEDLPEDIINDLESRVKELIEEINNHLHDNKRGEKIRNGLSLAIIGAPNVGKSSLINYLAKSEVAIISDIAGTTRDIVETHLEIAGIAVVIADTAGLRETEDLIEKEGVKRALKKADLADLKILVLDVNDLKDFNKNIDISLNDSLVVINKVDLKEVTIPDNIKKYNPILISIKNKINLEELLRILEEKVKNLTLPGNSALITRQRYRYALKEALDNLSVFSLQKNIELAAEDLRLAVRAIGKITGKVEVDDILDVIFSGFCIGK